MRTTHNSKPLNPHDLVARLPGSSAAVSHDVNLPLNALIRTGIGNLFEPTPFAILQPRTAIAWQIRPKTLVRTGFGLFSDLLPGSIADLIGANPPYVNTFQGGLLGTVGGMAIAPGAPDSAVAATARANQNLLTGFERGELSCASRLQIQMPVFRRSRSRQCRTESCTRLTLCNGVWRSSINSATP